jgi:hypothetical protein
MAAELSKRPGADDPALAEAVRRLVVAYQPERIYLFGSLKNVSPKTLAWCTAVWRPSDRS